MKKRQLALALILFSAACSAPTELPTIAAPLNSPTAVATPTTSPTTSVPPLPKPKNAPASAVVAAPTKPANPSEGGILLFDIGMHIEPLGATTSTLVSGSKTGNSAAKGASYLITNIFNNHVKDINTVAAMVEKHGGRMTIQAQSPFTTVAAKINNTLLADLEARGHEIGLHFHEDAHLGKNANVLDAATWCAVMQEEIGFIKQTGVKKTVRYWSGGNLYPKLLDAAACAGLDVNSDWKNPQAQETDPRVMGVHPWRPAGGSNGTDVGKFAQSDPNGRIIFLPEGIYARNDFASMRRSETTGGDAAYFAFLRSSFEDSLAAASPDKVNVFHFTVHPGEFKGDVKNPFAVIDQFLTEVVDPAVKAGKVNWATFSEMADSFRAWEKTHPGMEPR